MLVNPTISDEVNSRLAAMHVRELLGKTTTKAAPKTATPCPISNATDKQVRQFSEAREAVHALLYPEKTPAKSTPKQTTPKDAAPVKAQAAATSPGIGASHEESKISCNELLPMSPYPPARFCSGPMLSMKPSRQAFRTFMQQLRTHTSTRGMR